MTDLLEPLLAVAVGVASALLPLVNAEAFALVAVARTPVAVAVAVVVALAVGQTVGKLVLFEAARRGSGRLHARFSRHGEGGRAARWAERVRGWLTRRRTGVPTVLAAASVGLPPLAVVGLAAGAAGQHRWEFGVMCLVGRTARFGVLAMPVVLAW